jgi:CTP:molybdopterin cytidylyltransferase MocA
MQNKINAKEFSAIILSAGESSRMGVPKLSLQFDENTIFIQQIVNEFTNFGCNEIIVVVNEIGNKYLTENEVFLPENVKIVVNKHPEWHRFYSLKIGVVALSKTNNCFVHNVDNPFVSQSILKNLAKEINKADYINPQYNGKGGHPFFISGLIQNNIKSATENELHLKDFLNQYKRLKVAVDDKYILVNINTKEEYQKYFSS